MTDPFRFHPELRERITDENEAFWREFSVEKIIAQYPELAEGLDWVYDDETREAIRAKALAEHSGDLWIFAYGSLMWTPALRFTEVRRAHARGLERRFILCDNSGGRGTRERPGLMAALDRGRGCDGVVFRIAAEDVDTETEILFRREAIGPGYLPEFLDVDVDGGSVTALTFVADHDCDLVLGDVSREEQVRMIATGEGILGTSRDYLANIVAHFEHLGIEDPYCSELLEEVEAFRSARPTAGSWQ